MKKRWKQSLKQCYQIPEPKRKQEFFRTLGEQELSLGEFVWMQAGYLKKWSWFLAAAVLAIAFWGQRCLGTWRMWNLSVAVPFLALEAVTQTSRSARYGMEELELSARFSLKMTVLSRMGVLGLGDFVLLAAGIPAIWGVGIPQMINAAVYIMIPYLLTVFLSLLAVRHRHGKEGSVLCMAAAGSISVLYLILGSKISWVYVIFGKEKWLAVLLVLIFLSIREIRRTLKQMEEYAWNLSLTD